MNKQPRIEIFTQRNKGLGFRVRSKNGRTVVVGEDYNSYQSVQKSVRALTDIMASDPEIRDLRSNGRKTSVKSPA